MVIIIIMLMVRGVENERFEFGAIESEIFDVARSFLAQIVLDLLEIGDGFAESRVRAPQSGRPQALFNSKEKKRNMDRLIIIIIIIIITRCNTSVLVTNHTRIKLANLRARCVTDARCNQQHFDADASDAGNNAPFSRRRKLVIVLALLIDCLRCRCRRCRLEASQLFNQFYLCFCLSIHRPRGFDAFNNSVCLSRLHCAVLLSRSCREFVIQVLVNRSIKR